MRQSWTDDRLDDFRSQTEENFRRVDLRFDQVDKRFEQVDKRFEQAHLDIKGLHSEMNQRFEALNRTLLQIGGGMIAALLGILATQL